MDWKRHLTTGLLGLGAFCVPASHCQYAHAQSGGLAQGPVEFQPKPQEAPATSRLGNSQSSDSNFGLLNPTTNSSPTARPSARPTRSSSSSARNTYVRVARAPNMFGDTLTPAVTLTPFNEQGSDTSGRELFTAPLGGGGSFNVSENNTALPTDRVYFIYNAFYNAASATINADPNGFDPIQKSIDLHRYLIGFEKTFFDGNVSIDVRMPFMSNIEFNSFGLISESGNVGNLTMYMKGLLAANDDAALATGLGIGLPTGSDFESYSDPALYSPESLVVRNQAVHLMPFLAATAHLGEHWFTQSFCQMNFSASGNEIANQDGFVGIYQEQHLFQADLGLGRWLWQDSTRPYFQALAAVTELHYTTTVQNTDSVDLPSGNLFGGSFSNAENRLDLLNLTSGLQAQLSPLTALRVGAVVPLRNTPDRSFDAELQVSLNRKF